MGEEGNTRGNEEEEDEETGGEGTGQSDVDEDPASIVSVCFSSFFSFLSP